MEITRNLLKRQPFGDFCDSIGANMGVEENCHQGDIDFQVLLTDIDEHTFFDGKPSEGADSVYEEAFAPTEEEAITLLKYLLSGTYLEHPDGTVTRVPILE